MRPEHELNLDPSMGQDPDGPPEELIIPEEAVAETPAEEVEAAAPEQEKLLRIRIRSTGKEYVGKTDREILTQLAADQERMGADLESRESERTEVRGKARYQQEHAKPEGYDDQHYLDLLGKDTLAARRYQDRYYYGMSEDEDPAEAFRFTYRQADRVEDSMQIYEFKRLNPDLAAVLETNDDAAQLVLKAIDKEDLEINSRNLAAITRELIARGRIAPTPKQPAAASYEDISLGETPPPQPQRPVSRGQSGPRGTGGGAREASTSVRNYDNMTLEELKKEARKHNLLQ